MGNRKIKFTNTVLIRITDKMKNWLDKVAESKDGTVAGVVREIVKEKMKDDKEEVNG
jgi:predicted DNA-binding protein